MRKKAGTNFNSRVNREVIFRFNKESSETVGKLIESGDWIELHSHAIFTLWNSRVLKHPQNIVLESFPSVTEFELILRPTEDGKEFFDKKLSEYSKSLEEAFI